MKIVSVINQKGGVGKTTSTVNLGAGLARLGRRVLLLDLDPQSNLTLHVDRRPDMSDGTMTQLLVEDRPIKDLLQPTGSDRLMVIPADTSLGGVEQVLANRIGRETILREAFEAYDGEPFDYVLIDCPPSLGVLSANALCSSHEVVIPMQTEYFSLQGMAKLTEVIDLVKRRLNPDLQILCVLPCMVDLRTRLTTEVLENIRGYFGDRLARTLIRTNVKLAEAPSFGTSIYDHAPESNGAVDYWCFTLEVLERHGVRVPEDEFRAAAGDLVTDEIFAVDEDWVEEDEETEDDGTAEEPLAEEFSAAEPAEQSAEQSAEQGTELERPRDAGADGSPSAVEA